MTMKLNACSEVRDVIQTFQTSNIARALLADRFVHKGVDERKKACSLISGGDHNIGKHSHILSFYAQMCTHSRFPYEIVEAKLESPLILNTNSAALENGGISLERNSGIPLIPGSAIKGAARRSAIHQLCLAKGNKKLEILDQIVKVFGCVEQDLKPGRSGAANQPISDLWWGSLNHDSGEPEENGIFDRWLDQDPKRPRKGAIDFLPAVSNIGDITTEILTPHNDAVDGVEVGPKPIAFPAISAGGTFAFLLRANRPLPEMTLTFAKGYLEESLTTWGIGAKTAAGHGFFTIPNRLTPNLLKMRIEEQTAKQVEAAKIANLNPIETLVHQFGKLTDDELKAKLGKIASPEDTSEDEQIALLTLLAQTPEKWEEQKKGKNKKSQNRVKLIRDLETNLRKEGKLNIPPLP